MIKLKLLRFFMFLVFRSRGSVISPFGSMISPTEFTIQNSPKMQSRLSEFKELVRPVVLPSKELKRYGSKGDGGYVVARAAIRKSKFLISGGIENNNEFEFELAKLGIVGIQIDNSIDSPPKVHKNLKFIRATIGDLEEVNISKLVSDFPKSEFGILKLDIEGSEYLALKQIATFDKFNVIIVEFHELHRIVKDDFWVSFKKTLTTLKKNHDVIYISANNCCGYSILGGIPTPNVLEITFIKRSIVSGRNFTKINTLYPTNMKANYQNRAHLDISHLFSEFTL